MTPVSTTLPGSARLTMTADEFLAFTRQPENADKWFELVKGEVIEVPPPTRVHGAVCANVVRILGNYPFRRRKGYVASNDAGVLLSREPDTVRGPDVALYEDAQRFEDLHPEYGEVPPVLAVEVFSPGDKHGRVMTKIDDYLRTG